MSTTLREPQTAAGRALRDYLRASFVHEADDTEPLDVGDRILAIEAEAAQDSRVGVERLAEAIDHAEREGGNYHDMKRSRWLAGRILARLPLTLIDIDRLAREAEEPHD